MDNNIAIEVKNLTKIYPIYNDKSDRLKESLSLTRKKYHKDFYALNDVSFTINKGEVFGILGQNGSGKSTLLKMITGVLGQTSGEIAVNGKISALLELGAGFNQEMTGIENIYLNGTIMGYTKEEMDAKIPQIVDFAAIGDFVNQPVKMYSSGMFARLAFAVAINVEPDILIVDEALSVGDVFFQAKCYNKFEEFKKLKKTILFVSHDLGSIAKYCDKVMLLNRGNKIIEANPKEGIDVYKKVLVNQFDLSVNNEVDANEYDIIEECDEEWKRHIQINPDFMEYGSKLAIISDFAIIDSMGKVSTQIDKGETFSIKMRIKFNEAISEPIFAIAIKDIKGTEMTGTNTILENINIPVCKKNDIREIVFTQRMDLQGGEYLLSLGCTGFFNDEFTVYHRLYDICSITVVSTKNSTGFYDMNSKIEVK